MAIYDEVQTIIKSIGNLKTDSIESIKIALGGKKLPDSAIDLDTLKSNVSKRNENLEFYETNGKPCKETSSRVKYKWFNSGLFNNEGETIYLGFLKNNKYDSFDFYFVGTYRKLQDNMKVFLKNSDIEPWKEQGETASPTDKLEGNNDLIKQLAGIMKLKGEWIGGWNESLLKSYLDSVDARIKAEINRNEQVDYRFNKDGLRIVYKISPQSIYGSDIKVMATYSAGMVVKKRVVMSDIELLKEGFDVNELDLKTVKFYSNIDELIIEPTEEQFDFNELGSITHIIGDRIDRFPEEYRSMSLASLYSKIVNSIKYSIKMCERDYQWAVPIYCRKVDEIQHLFPMYFTDDHSDEVKLAIIISNREDGGFRATTVIDIETAYSNACNISRPDNKWMTTRYE